MVRLLTFTGVHPMLRCGGRQRRWALDGRLGVARGVETGRALRAGHAYIPQWHRTCMLFLPLARDCGVDQRAATAWLDVTDDEWCVRRRWLCWHCTATLPQWVCVPGRGTAWAAAWQGRHDLDGWPQVGVVGDGRVAIVGLPHTAHTCTDTTATLVTTK